MYRLTARLLLVLLLASTFVPVAMAMSGPVPHACCMRRPMHEPGSGAREVREVGGRTGNCCPPVTTGQWAELGSEIESNAHPLLAYLSPGAHPSLHSDHAVSLRPVRGPPLS
jgi:hypothetical protein